MAKPRNKPGVMAILAAERGQTVEEMVTEVLNQEGTIAAAARALGVVDLTIRGAILRLGLVPVTTVVWRKPVVKSEEENA